MTALRLLVLLLTTAAAFAAVRYTKLDRRNSPIAWYLSCLVALDALRLVVVSQLPETPEIRSGAYLWLRHASQAAYLGLIAALPAMSAALFLRRWTWPVYLAAFGTWVSLTACYPSVRGSELLQIYSVLELASSLVSVGCLLTWAVKGDEKATVPICSAVVLIAGSLTVCVLPGLAGAGTLEHWHVIVALHGFSLAIVLVLQLYGTLITQSRKPRKDLG